MALKAVIFDMDGVIVDTEPEYQRVEMELVKKYDRSMTLDDLKEYTGINSVVMWTHIKERLNLPQSVEELYQEEERLMQEYYENGDLKVIEPTVSLIKSAHEQGYRTGIASSSEKININLVLSRLNIGDCFDAVVSGSEVPRHKPYPDIYLHTAQLLGVAAEECIVVEDSMAGVAAARAAGMRVIRYVAGGSQKDIGEADYLVSDMAEVTVPLLEKLMNG
jgi:HAD superfamily hydrolase (TIGR01509 family)